MTFNILYLNYDHRARAAGDVPNRIWDNRKGDLLETINKQSPDIIGLQEAFHTQIEYIYDNGDETSLKTKGYEWRGFDRDLLLKVGHEEYTPIFFQTPKFEKVNPLTETKLLEKHKFETPVVLEDEDEGGTFRLHGSSKGSGRFIRSFFYFDDVLGAHNNRICTWVKLRIRIPGDTENSIPIYVFNTHLENDNPLAIQMGAEAIAKRIEILVKRGDRVILMGDFNTHNIPRPFLQDEDGNRLLYETFEEFSVCNDINSLFLVDEMDGKLIEKTTFHNFNGWRRYFPTMIGSRVDFVLISKGFTVKRCEIVEFEDKKLDVSDHFPVVVDLEL